MSINIHITSEGTFTSPSGKIASYYKSFPCAQTPSKVTDEIMGAPDQIQAYKDWMKSREYIEIEEIYDIDHWDDEIDDYKVIGTREYSYAQEHIDELTKFVQEETELGFKIIVSCM